MAYAVTALVRRACLPRSLRCRPVAKLCLLALADRCDDRGEGAWPSLATIAAEAEVDDERTVTARLRSLRDLGLIFEQEAPRPRRPRIWGLNLGALLALDPNQQLPFDDPADASGVQVLVPLAVDDGASGVQIVLPGVQIQGSGVQVLAPDPVLRSDPLILINASEKKKERRDYGGDLGSARDVIRRILTTHPDQVMVELLAAADQECRALGVDLGVEADHVLARAYLLEHVRLKFARATLPMQMTSTRSA